MPQDPTAAAPEIESRVQLGNVQADVGQDLADCLESQPAAPQKPLDISRAGRRNPEDRPGETKTAGAPLEAVADLLPQRQCPARRDDLSDSFAKSRRRNSC